MKKALLKYIEGDNTSGIVVGIIECNDDGLKGLQIPINQFIWDCTNYNVNIGDTFKDGIFYNDGKQIEKEYDLNDKINRLSIQTNDNYDELSKRQSATEEAVMGLMNMQMNIM